MGDLLKLFGKILVDLMSATRLGDDHPRFEGKVDVTIRFDTTYDQNSLAGVTKLGIQDLGDGGLIFLN